MRVSVWWGCPTRGGGGAGWRWPGQSGGDSHLSSPASAAFIFSHPAHFGVRLRGSLVCRDLVGGHFCGILSSLKQHENSYTRQFPGKANGTPLQDSCLENPVDGGAWWAAVHGVAKSRTRLSDFTFTFHFHALEKAMATHSNVLAWSIPGTGEPGGLPSLGSHRIRHDWSDLPVAAAVVQKVPWILFKGMSISVFQ